MAFKVSGTTVVNNSAVVPWSVVSTGGTIIDTISINVNAGWLINASWTGTTFTFTTVT